MIHGAPTHAHRAAAHGPRAEPATGAPRVGWRVDVGAPVAAQPVSSPDERTLCWRFRTSGDVDAPLSMLSDGSLVVASEDGTITLLLP